MRGKKAKAKKAAEQATEQRTWSRYTDEDWELFCHLMEEC